MEVSLKVGCLPYAVGKQPSIPMINRGRKWTLNDDDDDEFGESTNPRKCDKFVVMGCME